MSLWQKVKHFSELVVFEHTAFSAAFILVAMIVASLQKHAGIWFGLPTLLLCALALISARNFAMSFNRLVDRDIDALNERTKHRPSVDGRITTTPLLLFCAINAVVFIVTSHYINQLAFYLSLPFLMILGGYSFMKRFSSMAHIVLGLSLGLAPIAGCIAILGIIEIWCLALCIAVMFWVAGFDLLYSLQDVEFDSKHHLHSIPARFGARTTLYISRIFHLCAVVFWAFFISQTQVLGILSYVGLGVCALMLIYEQYLVYKDFENIPRAFFTTNGYLGFVFLVFIMIDGGFNYGI